MAAEGSYLHSKFPDMPCEEKDGYCDSYRYRDWEQNVAKPYMEALGYSDVAFWMIEKDSFGPLIRGVRCKDVEGKEIKFFYG